MVVLVGLMVYVCGVAHLPTRALMWRVVGSFLPLSVSPPAWPMGRAAPARRPRPRPYTSGARRGSAALCGELDKQVTSATRMSKLHHRLASTLGAVLQPRPHAIIPCPHLCMPSGFQPALSAPAYTTRYTLAGRRFATLPSYHAALHRLLAAMVATAQAEDWHTHTYKCTRARACPHAHTRARTTTRTTTWQLSIDTGSHTDPRRA